MFKISIFLITLIVIYYTFQTPRNDISRFEIEIIKLRNIKYSFDQLHLALRKEKKENRVNLLTAFQEKANYAFYSYSEIETFEEFDIQSICAVETLRDRMKNKILKCRECIKVTQCSDDKVGLIVELSSGKLKFNSGKKTITNIFPEFLSISKNKKAQTQSNKNLFDISYWNAHF